MDETFNYFNPPPMTDRGSWVTLLGSHIIQSREDVLSQEP